MPASLSTPEKLHKEVRDNFAALKDWRDLYSTFEKEYKGSNAGYTGIKGRRPVNLLQEMVDGVEPDLAPQNVRCAVTAKRSALAVNAELLALEVDSQLAEMNLQEVAEDIAHECLFAPCVVVRVGRHEGVRKAELDGEEGSGQEAFARMVSFANLSLDTSAKTWAERTFCAERIQCRKMQAMAVLGRDPEELAPGDVPEGIEVMTRVEAEQYIGSLQRHGSGWASGDAKSPVARGARDNATDNDDTIQLWYCAIYYGNIVYKAVIADTDGQPGKFLLFERAYGHPRGPFEFQRITNVSDSLLGVPLLSKIYDLHDSCKKLGNKLVKQLLNIKNLGVANKSNRDDAAAVKKAEDQDLVLLNDVKGITVLPLGGIRPEFMVGLDLLQTQFGNQSGNVRQTGGTQQAADTATAASYLQAGGQKRIQRSQRRIKRLLDRVVAQIAFLCLFAGEPDRVGSAMRRVEMPLPDGQVIAVVLRTDEMAKDAMEFNFAIQSWNAPPADPMVQARRIVEYLGLVGQMLPLVQLGLIKPAGLISIGRANYGIDNIDELINDPTGMRQQVEAAAFQGVPIPPQVNHAMQFLTGMKSQQPRGRAFARGIDEVRSAAGSAAMM